MSLPIDLSLDIPPAELLGRVHFVGIGGAGMSGIARVFLARGLPVSGSDAKDSRTITALRAEGARIAIGHDAVNIAAAHTVVVSSAVRATNPEVVAARERGLLVMHRSQALVSLMQGRTRVAVAGTNGKTTTTSMLTVALQRAGADPSFAIGGELTESGTNAHHGTGPTFVAEADESDGSFVLYRPHIAVVTNVQPDHLDHYGTAEAVEQAFLEFARGIPPDGVLVACADDDGSRRLAGAAADLGIRVLTYGRSPDADVVVEPLETAGAGQGGFALREPTADPAVEPAVAKLLVPGWHNVLNAAAAYTAATRGLGLDRVVVRGGLEQYTGTRRRFEPRGSAAGVRVVDDYAHNPGKVAAVLQTARSVAAGGRVVVVFQPHLFSRTRDFATDFGAALGAADEVVVMDVYAAREDPVPGVTGALVAAAVPLPADHVAFVPSWSAVADEVVARLRPGDILLTVGAGDVTLLGPEILARLESAASATRGAR
ncbi:MAG: UDP-N-acetylmuramate--L-alanine ligase [Actinomycetales bacterium]